jgi:hypothetical protein
VSQSDFAFQFKALDVELLFAKRLREHHKRVFDGLTTSEITKDRIRQAIIDSKVDCAIFGRNPAGKPETYQAAFERHFNEPLYPKPPKGKRSC